MNIKIDSQILKELKERLDKEGKSAARFILADFGCSGPIFDIELDEQKETDMLTEIEGVKFVAENKFAPAITTLEVIKTGDKFTVEKSSCGCGC